MPKARKACGDFARRSACSSESSRCKVKRKQSVCEQKGFSWTNFKEQCWLKYFTYISLYCYVLSLGLQNKTIQHIEARIPKGKYDGWREDVVNFLRTDMYVFAIAIKEIFLTLLYGVMFDMFGCSFPAYLSFTSLVLHCSMIGAAYGSESEVMLLLSRLIHPFMQGFLVLNLIILELYPKCRSYWNFCYALAEIGLVHMLAKTTSMILAPFLINNNYGIQWVYQLALLTSLVPLLTSTACIPVGHRKGTENRATSRQTYSVLKAFALSAKRALNPCHWRDTFSWLHVEIILSRILLSLPFYCYQTVFAEIAEAHVGVSQQNTLAFLLVVSIFSVIFHYGAVCWIGSHYCDSITSWASLLQLCCYAAQFVTSNHYQLYGIALIQIISIGLVHILMTFTVLSTVSPQTIGFAMGANLMIFQGTRLIAPTLGNLLVQSASFQGISSFGIICCIIPNLILFGIVNIRQRCLAKPVESHCKRSACKMK